MTDNEIIEAKKIKLSDGQYAIVDADMYDELSQFKWCLVEGYPIRGTTKDGIQKRHLMHRVVNDTLDCLETDHINGNKLDNRKCNLRSVTRTQNEWNKKPRFGGSSKYKGVDWHPKTVQWRIRIRVNGKRVNLGYSHNEVEAAKIYNEAALKYHGEFAGLNIIGR
ncbi:hypothetical protein LCGC14_3151770 [marine sediment metagenome]|uniref:AP2/ERF domain-containing protein n=1 Tax=marine sediment metagenome TaxID=412755 RepID=A0A0F8WHW9_9ZZZZ